MCPLPIGCLHLPIPPEGGIHGFGMIHRLGRCIIMNIDLVAITILIIGEAGGGERTA
jgi:hypothetical protein